MNKYFTLAPDGIEESSQQYAFDGGIYAYGGDPSILGNVHLEYRFIYDPDDEENGADNWLSYAVGQPISKWSNDWFGIQFRNITGSFTNNPNTEGNHYYNVRSTFAYVASGRITSLLDYRSENPTMPAGAFFRFFNETLIQDASDLILPEYVSNYCYTGLFRGCAQLKKAPELPAKELASFCYFYMFNNCTALTKVVLPATSGYSDSYNQLFSGCTGINEIVFNYPQWPASPNVGIDWMLETTNPGTFYYTNTSFDTTAVPRTTAGVPSNWQMAYLDTTPYLRLTSLEENNVICLTQTGSPTTPNLQYRSNLNLEWQTYPIGTQLTLFKDSWIEFRNTSGKFSTSVDDYFNFTASKNFNVSGRIGSLLFYSQELITATVDYAFYQLFNGCITLVDASELDLNLQTAGVRQCEKMFFGCESLVGAPKLHAVKLSNYCYMSMFASCSSLTKAPNLIAPTLMSSCYYYMFMNCTSLVEAPEIHARTLASNCYSYMFNNTKISHIVWRSNTAPSTTYCNSWLVHASASGTFEYTNPSLNVTSIPRNANGVPEGWTISQIKPQQGMSLSINGINVSSIKLSSSPISTLYINGNKVKSQAAIGTDIELPSMYTKLLYVDSNGGYLDTGVPTNGDLKVGIKWSKTKSGNSTWPELFGNQSLEGLSGQYYKAFALRCNTTDGHYDYYHGLYSNARPTYGARIAIAESSTDLGPQVHAYWMDPTNFSFDGQQFNIVDYTIEHDIDHATDWEFQPSRLNNANMRLFSSYTSNRFAIINCYNFYIVDTKTNTVLLNYIPCKLGSLVGFYDSVTQTFVTHNSFVAGPEA